MKTKRTNETQSTIREDRAPTFKLAMSAGEPELPGMAEWRAAQQKRARDEKLRADLASFETTKETK